MSILHYWSIHMKLSRTQIVLHKKYADNFIPEAPNFRFPNFSIHLMSRDSKTAADIYSSGTRWLFVANKKGKEKEWRKIGIISLFLYSWLLLVNWEPFSNEFPFFHSNFKWPIVLRALLSRKSFELFIFLWLPLSFFYFLNPYIFILVILLIFY